MKRETPLKASLGPPPNKHLLKTTLHVGPSVKHFQTILPMASPSSPLPQHIVPSREQQTRVLVSVIPGPNTKPLHSTQNVIPEMKSLGCYLEEKREGKGVGRLAEREEQVLSFE